MNTTQKLLLLIFISILSINCNNSPKVNSNEQLGKISLVSAIEFKEQSTNQTIIDIRTPQEFAMGHIEGAININYYDRSFMEQVAKLDKNKPIYMYCRSGNRTSSASKKLIKIGFTEVIDLDNGIISWAKNQYKIVK